MTAQSNRVSSSTTRHTLKCNVQHVLSRVASTSSQPSLLPALEMACIAGAVFFVPAMGRQQFWSTNLDNELSVLFETDWPWHVRGSEEVVGPVRPIMQPRGLATARAASSLYPESSIVNECGQCAFSNISRSRSTLLNSRSTMPEELVAIS